MAIAVAATYGDLWAQSATPKTASVTVENGDMLVVLCCAGGTGITFSASGGSPALTFTNRVSKNVTQSSTAILTAPSSSAQTFTISVNGTTVNWGFIVLRCTGVLATGGSVGYADAVTGIEQTPITTTAANSAIAVILRDGSSGAAKTWLTNAGTFTPQGTTNTTQSNFPGIHLNAGAAGTYTIGTTSTGIASNISALELTPVLPTANPRPPLLVRQAAKRATFW